MNGVLARIWPIIALAFPVLEIVSIVMVWDRIGAWTLAWLLLAMLAGSALIAVERVAFMPGMAAAMLAGGNPFDTLKSSGLRFFAGVLLIIPGAVSDVMALVMLLWAGFRPPPPPPSRYSRGPAANDDVIEGEFRRMD